MTWRRLGAWLLAAVLLTGCSKLSLPFQKEAPKDPVKNEPPPTASVSAGYRTLLPQGAVEWQATFDDGTPSLAEGVLPTAEALVGTQGGKAYVTWHLRPEGVFRRDPSSGSFLRYLPADLQDGLVWSQVSGGATFWFYLQGCGADCWYLHLLKGKEIQRFRFAAGRWVTEADLLSLAQPAASFHKKMVGEPAPSRQTAKPETWDGAKVAPVQEGTAAQFQAERDRMLQAVTTGPGPAGGRVLGPWQTWAERGAVELQADGSWKRTGCDGRCWYGLVSSPSPAVIVLTDTKRPGQSPELTAWFPPRKGATKADVWLVDPPVSADSVQIRPDGDVVIEHKLKDPARHTEWRTFRVAAEGGGMTLRETLEAKSIRPTEASLRDPATPDELLQAALFAHKMELREEFPRYFSDQAAAQAFASQLGDASSIRFWGSKVGRRTGDPNQVEPMQAIQAGSLSPDGWADFVLWSGFCCTQQNVWGRAQFVRVGGLWKLARVDVQGQRQTA
jgi:hypothetical protein